MAYTMDGQITENIYNLIPRESYEEAADKRYKSKFKKNVKQETVQNKTAYQTMGPAAVQTRGPDMYLKKHEKEPVLPEARPFQYPDKERCKPAVPKATERPVMGLRTNKNFVNDNAVENITAVPKKPQKNYVDTRRGDKHALIPSGLEPVYIHTENFGKVPEYLRKRQDELAQNQVDYDNYIADRQQRHAMRQLSEEDRNAILCGLKCNWENLHRQFLSLSVVIDTQPKKLHKERLEHEMQQLERDIQLLESHRIIYIAN